MLGKCNEALINPEMTTSSPSESSAHASSSETLPFKHVIPPFDGIISSPLPTNNTKAILWSLAATLSSFLFGFHIAFSSPTAQDIRKSLGFNELELSLIFSILNIGAIFGAMIGGSLAEILGSRNGVALSSIPYFFGSLLMISSSFIVVLIGRLCIGVGVGLTSVVVPLYITEISPNSLRGVLGCLNQILITIGIASVNGLGFEWMDSSQFYVDLLYTSCVPAVVLAVIMLVAPNSPRFLVSQRKFAKAALRQLRGSNADVREEIDRIEISDTRHQFLQQIKELFSFSTYQRLSTSTGAKRQIITGVLLNVFQQCSGINAIMFNAASLFSRNGGSLYNALIGATLVSGVQVVVTIFASLFVDRMGRLKLIIPSYWGMCFFCSLMAIASLLSDVTFSIVVIILYVVCFACGSGPLTGLISSEISPLSDRNTLMSLYLIVNWLSSFVVTLLYIPLSDMISESCVFILFACSNASAAIFIKRLLPETKGKSLEEIEQSFQYTS